MQKQILGRILVHSFALVILNLASIVVAFAVYKATGAKHQIPVQVPVAILLSIVGFLVWVKAAGYVQESRHIPHETWEIAGIYSAALVWVPLLFVPIHFVITGYLTAIGNIIGLWLFQIPANFLALLVAWGVLRRGRGLRPRSLLKRFSVEKTSG